MAEVLLDPNKEQGKSTMLQNEQIVGDTDVQQLPDSVAENLVQLFKLFSDETRLRILHFLMQREELNVRTLCRFLDQSQPAVSHHLALLKSAGLIHCRRDGKHNFYRIVSDRFQQFVELIFESTPREASNICFKTFSLSYKPLSGSA